MQRKNIKLELISPKKKTDGNEREFWDAKFISLVYGIPKYSCAFLALATLAALTPPDIEVSITDENIEDVDFDNVDFDNGVDLVGITSNTFLAPRAYEIADEFRTRGIAVILGGIHASMLPEEAIQHADAVVIGEAENVWTNLINDYRIGKLQQFYKSSERPKLENQPIPRWDLLKNERYVFHILQTSRGCPYDCEFCTVKAMNGKRYRFKPVKNVIREIEALISIQNKLIFFADDNFIGNRRHAKELLRELVSLKIVYFAQASLDITKDDELLQLLAESGCKRVLIGFESLSEANLEQMNKGKPNKVEEYAKDIQKIQSYGFEVQASFIFGYDFDNTSTFEKTANFINEANIASPVLNILTPFPGTRLFERLESEERLLHKDWMRYDSSQVCFKPKSMSPEALQNGYIWNRQQVYSYGSIFERLKGLWNLWNQTHARLQDRTTPIIGNLGGNDVAYSYPEAIHPEKFAQRSKQKLLQNSGFSPKRVVIHGSLNPCPPQEGT